MNQPTDKIYVDIRNFNISDISVHGPYVKFRLYDLFITDALDVFRGVASISISKINRDTPYAVYEKVKFKKAEITELNEIFITVEILE